jgi:hypothetical protein
MENNYTFMKIKPLSNMFCDPIYWTNKPNIVFYIYELVLNIKSTTYTAGEPIYSFEKLTDDELKRLTWSPNLCAEIHTIEIPTDKFRKIVGKADTDVNNFKSQICSYLKHKEMWCHSEK